MKFQDPPKAGNCKYDHQSIAAELKANPGRWALVFENVFSSLSVSIKSGRLAAYRPAGSFEALSASRNGSTNKADIYVRYVGVQ